MGRLSGPLLVATGVLDLLYVVAFHFRQLAAIVQDGFFGAVELDPAQFDRETAFWHLTSGATIVLLGGLVHWAQSRTGTLPAFLGWSLLALGLFGAILLPASGFWLFLPQAVLVLAAARRGARAEAGKPGQAKRWGGTDEWRRDPQDRLPASVRRESSNMNHETAFYHDERCLWHTTGEAVLGMPVGGWLQPPAAGGHPESPETKRRLKALLDVSGLGAEVAQLSAPEAAEEDLLRVHTRDYLERFKAASDAGGGEEGLFAPFGAGSYEIAKRSAGLAKRAVSDVLSGRFRNAYSLSRPPGHHCLPDGAMGFCLLANIPIAIEAAKAEHGLGKVAVLDWDVHHGNGTQAIYYQRPDVLTISIHQDSCFPPGSGGVEERGEAAGEGFNANVPLPPGSGHKTYLHAVRRVVLPALERFGPDLIVIASGLDANAADPLARQMLYGESYREMTRLVMEAADGLCDGRLIAVHEGGYAESTVPFCGLAVVEELSGVRTPVEDPFGELFAAQQPDPRVVEFQRAIVDETAETLEQAEG